MPARLHVPLALREGSILDLPPEAARHVQVLRLQPGDALRLFNGEGGEWAARVTQMGRRDVQVEVGLHDPTERELPLAVTLALGVPANDRMDALVEKATELGVAAIQPLACERSVLRLAGERAERRREHWQAVAVAAAEQSGRTRVPSVLPVLALPAWLGRLAAAGADEARWLLSLGADAVPPRAAPGLQRVSTLSGPEGGLTESEEGWAREAGFVPVTLGPRVLRADTAPLAVLARLALPE